MPYWSANEVVDDIIRQFNELPVQFTTDPQSGQVIATKSMPKPMGPMELDPEYWNMFRAPNNPYWGMNEPNLRASWILPQGALEGPKFITREMPESDFSRQSAYNLGISNVGENTATLDPQTFWPESAFKVPLSQTAGGGQLPVFGTTVDYTKGAYVAPPLPTIQPFGRFEPQFKTPPGYGQIPQIPKFQAPQYRQSYRQPNIQNSWLSNFVRG